jgi:hypothetical protein
MKQTVPGFGKSGDGGTHGTMTIGEASLTTIIGIM